MSLFVVEALGVAITITLSEADTVLRGAVETAWVDARTDAAAADSGVRVVVNPVDARADRAAELSALSRRVTRAAIDARAGEVWMLHAAGVALPDGGVVALVGPSGRGKTRAAMALGASFGYVSDETVAVTAEGTVLPYRKPLSVVLPGRTAKAECSASSLGLQPLPPHPLYLAALVLLDRRSGVSQPQVSAVPAHEALAELSAQSSSLVAMQHPLQTIAHHIASVKGVVRARYSEAETLLDLIAALGQRPPAVRSDRIAVGGIAAVPRARRTVVAESDVGTDGARADADGFVYSRAPQVVDAVHLTGTGTMAILQTTGDGAGLVRILAGIGPVLFDAADHAPESALVSTVLASFGQPDDHDAPGRVRDALAQMCSAGVLVCHEPHWVRSPDVAWTRVDDRVFAVSLGDPSSEPRVVLGVGAVIWNHLASPIGLEALVRRLADDAGLPPTQIHDDVARFLRDMEIVGLIVRSAEGMDADYGPTVG